MKDECILKGEKTIVAGYYKFTSAISDPLDPYNKEAVAAWLYNKISYIEREDCIKVNTYADLPKPPAQTQTSKYFWTLDDDKFYLWNNVTKKYTEVSPSSDANDYCYVQIWEMKPTDEYVLFAEKYVDGEETNPQPAIDEQE